jgi:hypothetical protein
MYSFRARQNKDGSKVATVVPSSAYAARCRHFKMHHRAPASKPYQLCAARPAAPLAISDTGLLPIHSPGRTDHNKRTAQETGMQSWYGSMAPNQQRTFWACFLGWALDAMDVQLFAFVIPTSSLSGA